MKKHSRTLHLQTGILALEPLVIMLLFIFIMVLANNGIVNVINQNWIHAANSAALAGAEKLYEKSNNPNAGQMAIDEAVSYALLQSWLGRQITVAQVTVTTGRWVNCTFSAGGSPLNAVRVDISAPVDPEGNLSGITALFGQIKLPMFATLPDQTTAVAAYYESKVVLVEHFGNTCVQ